MQEGQVITRLGELHEIKSIGKVFAITYILDDEGNRFKRFGKEGYLEGRVTINETKLLNL